MAYLDDVLKTVQRKNGGKTIRIAFWILLGLAISATGLALNSPRQTLPQASPTPTADVAADLGSTDGIMFVAVIILLIIITPILIKMLTWRNDRPK